MNGYMIFYNIEYITRLVIFVPFASIYGKCYLRAIMTTFLMVQENLAKFTNVYYIYN